MGSSPTDQTVRSTTDVRPPVDFLPADPLALVRLLSRRYLLALLAVALLVVVDEAIIQPQLVRLNFYAPAINVAGRQRMLSQKITKNALALATHTGPEERAARREQLLVAIDEWSAAHQGLLEGSQALGLEPIADDRIASALLALEPKLEAIQSAAAPDRRRGRVDRRAGRSGDREQRWTPCSPKSRHIWRGWNAWWACSKRRPAGRSTFCAGAAWLRCSPCSDCWSASISSYCSRH